MHSPHHPRPGGLHLGVAVHQYLAPDDALRLSSADHILHPAAWSRTILRAPYVVLETCAEQALGWQGQLERRARGTGLEPLMPECSAACAMQLPAPYHANAGWLYHERGLARARAAHERRELARLGVHANPLRHAQTHTRSEGGAGRGGAKEWPRCAPTAGGQQPGPGRQAAAEGQAALLL